MMVGFNAGDTLFDTAEETGGSKDAIVVSHTHTGSTSTAGSHTHAYATQLNGALGSSGTARSGDGAGTLNQTTQSAGLHDHTFTTNSTGSSGTNANLPPYIVVYLWKRTA
jgi:hypothetical protein